MKALRATVMAAAVTAAALGGCGTTAPAARLTDLAFSTNYSQEVRVGLSDYYSFHVGAPAHEAITVDRLRWVPAEATPAIRVLGTYVQPRASVSAYGGTWNSTMVGGFPRAQYARETGLTSPGPGAKVAAGAEFTVGGVIHVAAPSRATWTGIDVTYTAGSDTRTWFLPMATVICGVKRLSTAPGSYCH